MKIKFARRVAVAAAAAALLGSVVAAPAGAVDFTCGPSNLCFFANDNWTGTVTEYSALDVLGNTDRWTEIPEFTRGSVTDNNFQNVQVYAANTRAHQTVFQGTKAVLYGSYGWVCTGPWSDCDQHLPS